MIMDFATALQQHLDAIRQRDLDAFMATIGPDPTLILPTGVRISGRDTLREFHAVWFSDPDWTIGFEPLKAYETAEMAMALLDVDYSDIDAQGQPFEKHYYLCLVFVRQGDTWLLTHDQNTFLSLL
jgi:ketosteroid isomerase-like protein